MNLEQLLEEITEAVKYGDSYFLKVGRLWNEAKANLDMSRSAFLDLLRGQGIYKSPATFSKWATVYGFWVEKRGISEEMLQGKPWNHLYAIAEHLDNKARPTHLSENELRVREQTEALDWFERTFAADQPALPLSRLLEELSADPGSDPSEPTTIKKSIADHIRNIINNISTLTGERPPSKEQVIERALSSIPSDPVELVMWWARSNEEGGRE